MRSLEILPILWRFTRQSVVRIRDFTATVRSYNEVLPRDAHWRGKTSSRLLSRNAIIKSRMKIHYFDIPLRCPGDIRRINRSVSLFLPVITSSERHSHQISSFFPWNTIKPPLTYWRLLATMFPSLSLFFFFCTVKLIVCTVRRERLEGLNS